MSDRDRLRGPAAAPGDAPDRTQQAGTGARPVAPRGGTGGGGASSRLDGSGPTAAFASPSGPRSLPPFTVRLGDALTHPIDLEAFVRGVPPEATTKGHFVNQLGVYVKTARPEAHAEFVRRYPDTFPAFSEVPYKATLARGLDAARLAHPDVAPSEALRRMGRFAWQSVLDSMLGRVMFATLGRDLDVIYRTGTRAYEMFELRATRVRYERFGERHFRYDYRNCYNWIDAYQVGVIEGVALAFEHRTELTVRMDDAYNGSIECRWF